MKLHGTSPEAAGYRAAAANAGLLAARAGAWWMTGNEGFIVDAGHDVCDVVSLAAKGKALETESLNPAKHRHLRQRLRMGAAGLFLAGGLFGLYSGAHQLASGEHEDAGAFALATAGATALASLEIARRTHRGLDKHDSHDHPTARDLKLHVWGDGASSTVYALGLSAQAASSLPQAGSISLLASGGITTVLALKTINGINNKHQAHFPPHENKSEIQ